MRSVCCWVLHTLLASSLAMMGTACGGDSDAGVAPCPGPPTNDGGLDGSGGTGLDAGDDGMPADGALEGGGDVALDTPSDSDLDVDLDADLDGEGGFVCAWEPYATGLSGGRVADVSYDPRTPGVAWATTAARLLRSDDVGQTWAEQGAAMARILDISLPADQPDHIVAATASGVAHSTDGGISWTTLGLDGTTVTAALFHPAEPLRGYAAVPGLGILRSDNGGQGWVSASFGLPTGDMQDLLADPLDPDVLLGAAILLDSGGGWSRNGGVYRTNNGGLGWTVAEDRYGRIYRLARCTSDPLLIYAAALDGGILRSTDGGLTFQVAFAGRAQDVALAPNDCDVIYGTFLDGVRRSLDGAATFTPPLVSGIPFSNKVPTRIAVDPSDSSRLLAGTAGGLLYSESGGDQFELVGDFLGLVARRLASATTKPDRLWFATWGSGLWKRESVSADWEFISTDSDFIISVNPHPTVPDLVFAGTRGGAQISTDGATFTPTTLTANTFDFAFDPTDPSGVYAATQTAGVFKSVDMGTSWTEANTGLAPWPPAGFIDVRWIVVDPEDANRLYIGTEGSGLYRSVDGAASWSPIGTGLSNAIVGCLEYVLGSPASIYACISGGGLLRSTDGGDSWESASAGIGTLDIAGILQDPVSGLLYASAGDTVYTSSDGVNWTPFFGGCPGLTAGVKPALLEAGSSRYIVIPSDDLGVIRHPL